MITGDAARSPTPAVLIDRSRVLANIDRMQEAADRRGIRAAAARQDPQESDRRALADRARRRSASAAPSSARPKCSPTPASPISAALSAQSRQRASASSRLLDRTRAVVHRRSSATSRRAGRRPWRAPDARVNVLVKVDVGFHRCGIDPRLPRRGRVHPPRRSTSRPHACAGLLAHAGHAYHAASDEATCDRSRRRKRRLLDDACRRRARRDGVAHRRDQRRRDADGALFARAGWADRIPRRQLRLLRSHAGRPRRGDVRRLRADRAGDASCQQAGGGSHHPGLRQQDAHLGRRARLLAAAGPRRDLSRARGTPGLQPDRGLDRRAALGGTCDGRVSRAARRRSSLATGSVCVPNHACVVIEPGRPAWLVDGERVSNRCRSRREEGFSRDSSHGEEQVSDGCD